MLIDAAIHPELERAVARELDEALCLGISFFTGPMIGSAIRISQMAKRIRPDLPIVFGGWHPSLMPDQTLRPDFVDVVVRGQGELTLLELAQRLAEGKSLEGLRGASVKVGRQAIHNPERPVENINNLPTPAFDLADFDAYARGERPARAGLRHQRRLSLRLQLLHGPGVLQAPLQRLSAPSAWCGKCADLVSRYRLTDVAFLDSNFPVDVKRALAIARGFVESASQVPLDGSSLH